MGSIQLSIETHDLVTLDSITKGDFVTFDGRVIPCESEFADQRLTCHKTQNDSSKLRLLCRLRNGEVVLQTASLRESSQVYELELELARGELTRLRNFYHLWTGAGLKPSEQLDHAMAKAHDAFRAGVFSDVSAPQFIESITHTHRAIDLLIRLYTKQRITFRQQRSHHFPMVVGCRLSAPPRQKAEFLKAFSSVLIKTRWRELEPQDGKYEWEALDKLVEWATNHRMALMGGPLLDLSSDCFPEWMAAWKGDIVNLQSFASDFVETVVSRYVGRIRHWEVVCGPNRGGVNELTEEQRLNLILRVIEAAQQVDEQIQISLRVVQPWGEYLSTTENRLAPIQFVDTLRRSGVTLSEINLDLRFGSGDVHSRNRDMLNVSQLLDHWSLLQIPVNVMATIPEYTQDSVVEDSSIVGRQLQQMEDLFLMCLSKERVAGFYCLNWDDPDAEDEPLVDVEQRIHPFITQLGTLKKNHWAF